MFNARILVTIGIVALVIVVFVYLFIVSWLEQTREEKTHRRSTEEE